MIGGSGRNPNSGFTLITGIGAAQIVAVNPSNDEYKQIVGRDMPYDLKYDIQVLGDDRTNFRPINFLVKNVEKDVFGFVRFSISDKDDVSSTGSINSIDGVGNTAYINTTETNQYTWFNSKDSRPLKKGEAGLHKFLQTLVKYDSKAEEANWLVDLTSSGVTPQKLYNGDVSGLRALINWANSVSLEYKGDTYKGHTIGVLWTVKKSPKMDKDSGLEKPGEFNFNQDIHSGRDGRTFFYTNPDGSLSPSVYKRLKDYGDKQEEAGYSITDRLFTFKLQDFKEEDCRGQEPKDVAELEKIEAAPLEWN
jgi:hypothetical protein